MNLKSLKNFFFENIGIKQSVLKNTFWLTAAEMVTRIVQFILIVYITRVLGATEFGEFTFALSFVSIFVVLSDFGLSDITNRELSQDKNGEAEYSSVLSLKILFSIGATILTAIGAFFVTPIPIVRGVIVILAFSVSVSNFFSIIYAFLRSRQRMEHEALVKIIQAVVTIVIVTFTIFNFPSVENISWSYLAASCVSLIIVLLIFHFYVQPLKLNCSIAVWKKFFHFSHSLGLASIFGAILLNADSVIMGYLGQMTQNGWYAAAERVISFTVIPSTLLFMSFYPVLSKLFKQSGERFQTALNYYIESMIVLAVPITLGGFILSSQIISFIYNSNFNPSIFAFRILIFTTGISFIYSPYVMMLIVSGHQNKYFIVNLVAAIANIVLNVILIPFYSYYGAAVTAVITNALILILGIILVKKFISIEIFSVKLFKITLVVVLSAFVMAVAIGRAVACNLNIFLVIIAGILSYFAVLFCFYKYLFKLNFLSEKHE